MIKELISKGLQNNLVIEVYRILDKEIGLTILNDKITDYDNTNHTGYQIKGLKDNRFATINTESLDNSDDIINDLLKIIKLKDNVNTNILAKESITNRIITDKIDWNKTKKDLLSLNDFHQIDSRLKDFQISFSYINEEYELINNDATMLDQKQIYSFDASITASNGSETKIIYFNLLSKEYDYDKFVLLFKKKIEEVLFKLNSVSIPTKKYNIMITNEVMSEILKSFVGMFSSKLMYLKESILENKLNEKVFSNKLNIIEDPTNNLYIGTRIFDSEGTLTNKKYLIKDGVFVNKINNLEYAIKLNELPTGNAYGVRNLYIEPGNDSYISLTKKLNDGIIIDNVMGVHSGINSKTGNISLQAEGVLVEDGLIKKSLSTIILTTNIIELLNNIDTIGSDLVFYNTSCASPSIIFKDITVSGKEVK